MHLMTRGLLLAEDLYVNENMGNSISKYIVQICVGTGMTHIELNCVFVCSKPKCIAQQNTRLARNMIPGVLSTVITMLPWLVPEGRLRWRGSRGLGQTPVLSFLPSCVIYRDPSWSFKLCRCSGRCCAMLSPVSYHEPRQIV